MWKRNNPIRLVLANGRRPSLLTFVRVPTLLYQGHFLTLYFEEELDLQSASEGENADGEEEDDIENIDKDTEDEDEEENEEKDEEEDEDDGYASANESRHGKDEVAASRAASISSTSRTVISRVEEASQQKTADDSVTGRLVSLQYDKLLFINLPVMKQSPKLSQRTNPLLS